MENPSIHLNATGKHIEIFLLKDVADILYTRFGMHLKSPSSN